MEFRAFVFIWIEYGQEMREEKEEHTGEDETTENLIPGQSIFMHLFIYFVFIVTILLSILSLTVCSILKRKKYQ